MEAAVRELVGASWQDLSSHPFEISFCFDGFRKEVPQDKREHEIKLVEQQWGIGTEEFYFLVSLRGPNKNRVLVNPASFLRRLYSMPYDGVNCRLVERELPMLTLEREGNDLSVPGGIAGALALNNPVVGLFIGATVGSDLSEPYQFSRQTETVQVLRVEDELGGKVWHFLHGQSEFLQSAADWINNYAPVGQT